MTDHSTIGRFGPFFALDLLAESVDPSTAATGPYIFTMSLSWTQAPAVLSASGWISCAVVVVMVPVSCSLMAVMPSSS